MKRFSKSHTWQALIALGTGFVASGAICDVEPPDYDGDGMMDLLEGALAQTFEPYFAFDSAESATLANEPVVLWQAHPHRTESGQIDNTKVDIIYALLWQRDGGYGPDSWCTDSHHGDNQGLKVVIKLAGSQIIKVYNSAFQWPSDAYPNIEWYEETHPVIYLSAHKHHQYFDTSYNHDDSPYSDWWCNDDVNGQGQRKFGTITNGTWGHNNVGEPSSHSAAHFVNDLSVFGYTGENAWDTSPFCGGLSCEGGTGPMSNIWEN